MPITERISDSLFVKISVCIATYNGEKYIRDQLESILSQLDFCDEIVVSDDHSSDKTIAIIKSFNDDRIRVIYNSGQKGYTSNFENALKHAKGEYIFLSDQDDIWLKGKVDKCMEYLQDYDFVVSDAVIVNQDLETLKKSFSL